MIDFRVIAEGMRDELVNLTDSFVYSDKRRNRRGRVSR